MRGGDEEDEWVGERIRVEYDKEDRVYREEPWESYSLTRSLLLDIPLSALPIHLW